MSSKKTTVDTPNPGSPAAVALGCTCPRMDNAHGAGYLNGVKDDQGETLFVYSGDCPVHCEANHAKTE